MRYPSCRSLPDPSSFAQFRRHPRGGSCARVPGPRRGRETSREPHRTGGAGRVKFCSRDASTVFPANLLIVNRFPTQIDPSRLTSTNSSNSLIPKDRLPNKIWPCIGSWDESGPLLPGSVPRNRHKGREMHRQGRRKSRATLSRPACRRLLIRGNGPIEAHTEHGYGPGRPALGHDLPNAYLAAPPRLFPVSGAGRGPALPGRALASRTSQFVGKLLHSSGHGSEEKLAPNGAAKRLQLACFGLRQLLFAP